MDLLPKSREEFRAQKYWESFFKNRKDAFEWYGEYADLCGALHKYCKTNDKILVTGCGNSRISEDLYDVGYHDITNIDIAEIVIKQMNDRNSKHRENMKFLKMDVLEVMLMARLLGGSDKKVCQFLGSKGCSIFLTVPPIWKGTYKE